MPPHVTQHRDLLGESGDGTRGQVRVADNWGSDYLLPYPCELTKEGWVNAASGKPLAVRVTYWKPYVETLPKSKPRKRSPTNTSLRGPTPSAISCHAFGLKALRSGSPELRASIGKKRDANLKSCLGALH